MPDQFPAEEETWLTLKTLLEGAKFTERRKLSDARGVYLWEVRAATPDGTVEYMYKRDTHGSPESCIYRVYLDKQGVPQPGSTTAATFTGGRWIIIP